jgi:hypothetical protein
MYTKYGTTRIIRYYHLVISYLWEDDTWGRWSRLHLQSLARAPLALGGYYSLLCFCIPIFKKKGAQQGDFHRMMIPW